jgi:hypothetical protein
MFGHYDVTRLEVTKIEGAHEHIGFQHDYGLVKPTVQFSAQEKRDEKFGAKPRVV